MGVVVSWLHLLGASLWPEWLESELAQAAHFTVVLSQVPWESHPAQGCWDLGGKARQAQET